MASSFAAKVGLTFSCERLPKLYPNVDCISTVYVYMQQTSDKEFELVGNSDVQINTNDPEYSKIFYFDYYSRRRQRLRLDVWDVSNKDGVLDKNAVKIGSVELSLIRLIRLRGQPLNIKLLNEKGEALASDASITVTAVSIRREKKAPEEPPPPPPKVVFNWRRVKEWKFNDQERYHDWVDVPREEQTVELRRRGKVELPLEGNSYFDLMQMVLESAGLPRDPPLPPVEVEQKAAPAAEVDEFDFDLDDLSEEEQERRARREKRRGKKEKKSKKDKKKEKEKQEEEAPVADAAGEVYEYHPESDPEWDSELEDAQQRRRRQRKEEEMTPKEKALLRMHNRQVLHAYLSMTVNAATKQIRVISTADDTYNPSLVFLRDRFHLAGGMASRCISTLHSHGFVVWPAVERHSLNEHKELLARLRDFQEAEAGKLERGFVPDWKEISGSCRHCRAVVQHAD